MSARIDRTLLSSDEAARLLGVKKATLYTYASRGWIRTLHSGRQRRYFLEDVRALKLRAEAAQGHAAAASGALDYGAPVLDTEISAITPSGHRYRGHDALALAAQDTPFESVATLLWTGVLPAQPPLFDGGDLGVDPSFLPVLTLSGSSLDREVGVERLLPAFISLLFLSSQPSPDTPGPLLRRLAASIALCTGPQQTQMARLDAALSASSVAQTVAVALGADTTAYPRCVQRINRALVLCADHELNASTFAARVAASTGADDGAVLLAALGTWSGPRHGLASVPLERLVSQIAAGDAVLAADSLLAHFPLGAEAPGFGHRLYPDGDPRGRSLLANAAADSPSEPRWIALLTLLDAMRALGHSPPNLDAGLVGCATSLGLPEGAPRAIFAIGRVAGWLAHAHEQRRSGTLLRPRAGRL